MRLINLPHQRDSLDRLVCLLQRVRIERTNLTRINRNESLSIGDRFVENYVSNKTDKSDKREREREREIAQS